MLYGMMSYCAELTGEDLSRYYWPAEWASIVLLAAVCRLSSSVTLPAGGRVGGRARGRTAAAAPAAGRVGGWAAGHCTAGQCGYVALGRHLV